MKHDADLPLTNKWYTAAHAFFAREDLCASFTPPTGTWARIFTAKAARPNTTLSRDVPRAERLRNTFINPGVISNLIGLFCFLTPFKLPVVPATAVSYLASLNTPIAMIAVGAFLAQCDLRECFRDTQVYFVSALRLLILPLITLAVFLLLPLDHTLRCSMLISAAAPVAMAASLFGKTYGTDYLFSTRATAVSTIFSALTIPAMVALCQLLDG